MYKKFLFTITIFIFAVSVYAQKGTDGFKETLHDALADCQEYRPTIRGTVGDDILYGTEGDDVIHSYGGNDIIYAKGGNDIICGGSGADIISGGEGSDNIDGGEGKDTIFGGCPEGVIPQKGYVCDPEQDGADIIAGGDGADQISGNLGNDELRGDDGNDTISGNKGNDKIGCGRGQDTADGGFGDDEFFPPYNDCEQHSKVERPQLRYSVDDSSLDPVKGMYTRYPGRDYIVSGKIPCKSKSQTLPECTEFKDGFVQSDFVSCKDFYVDGVVDTVMITKSNNRVKRWERFDFICRELLPDGTKGESTTVQLVDLTRGNTISVSSVPSDNLIIGIMDLNNLLSPNASLREISLLYLPISTVYSDGQDGTTSSYSIARKIPGSSDNSIGFYDQVNRCLPGMAITGFSIGHVPTDNRTTKPYFILAECRNIEKRYDTY